MSDTPFFKSFSRFFSPFFAKNRLPCLTYRQGTVAPAWGATSSQITDAAQRRSFNPRTRVGCDKRRLNAVDCRYSFNPRTRVGCDIRLPFFLGNFARFQSTHPRGVRPNSSSPHSSALCSVNPRTRVGCDCSLPNCLDANGLFQSTHPRGVRPRKQLIVVVNIVTIHAPAWGATLLSHKLLSMIYVSIHAPAWGATKAGCFFRRLIAVSIHAPAWGATCFTSKASSKKWFQSTHPRGVRRQY